ncbi:MAG: metallophosphoesterase, partial [Sarcina sp.]
MKRKLKNKKLTSYLLVLTMIISLFIPTTNVLANEILNPEQSQNVDVTSENSTEAVNNEVIEDKEPSVEKVTENNEVTIQLLGTSDLHGKFTSFEYASGKKYDGGLTQISTIVKEARAQNPNTIVMDNGDTIQGNYNHLFLNDNWKNPMILGMNEIGYDVFSLGNHEFNFGMNRLNKIVSEANENLKILCANLYKDGERVFNAYTIKEFEGIKVAVIGVVSPHIMRWDSVNLVGYEATAPDEEVKKVIQEIKATEGADVFVVSSHVGLDSEYGGGDSGTDIANANPEVSAIL